MTVMMATPPSSSILLSVLLVAAASSCCHALVSPSSSPRLTRHCHLRPSISHHGVAVSIESAFRRSRKTRLSATADDDEQHLSGIGVGIDLGTTNSAVAMMIPAGDGDRRTVPAMIEIEQNGRTIPSVVSFISSLDTDDKSSQNSNELSLPPWIDPTAGASDVSTVTALMNLQWPHMAESADGENEQYQIYIGKQAIHHEQHHPSSTYRNVKRIIGTGGRMAQLASGVVPNLFIESINGNMNVGSSDGLDELFNFLEESDSNKKSKKNKKNKGKNKQNKKGKNKWQKRKESELPKLQTQLDEARDDPALLTCHMNAADAAASDDSLSSGEVLLRPEQISACILRKLYDTAEQYQSNSNNDNEEGKVVKVTRAVIGVPAYFTEAQRQATIRASELAGVSKVKLLAEPEAAALAYGAASSTKDIESQYDKEELILVFDLGGGTFDVSILEVGGGVTEVLATVGNNRLGGTDFDRRVAEYLSTQAVEIGRKLNTKKRRMEKSKDSLDGLEDGAGDDGTKKTQPLNVKDWYRQGSGEVPDIILRVAEEARKALSNQKVVEVLVPLTEKGWRSIGSDEVLSSTIGPSSFDKTKLETDLSMIENEDYAIISLDRKIFETICNNELQLLLQPIREVAIMAGVLLPGEARPSFAENALQMAKEREAFENDGEDFWEFEDEDDEDDDLFENEMLIKTGKDGISISNQEDSSTEEEALSEQALQQIQAMDINAQKKAQQRGRRKARDIGKKERSFRKQKQSAMEEATTASLLGQQPGGKKGKRGGGSAGAATMPQSTSTPVNVGNERVQDGIHGRPLTRIVLVGGATRMPVIAKLLEAVVGMVPQKTVHPDEAVALGCAVQAGILDGDNEGLLGGMQAVLSPMQAAVMRALAKKRGMEVTEAGELSMMGGQEGVGGDDDEMMMMGGISGMMVVDGFDDEDDFY